MDLTTRGSIHFVMVTVTKSTPIIFAANSIVNVPHCTVSHHDGSDERTISKIIAMRSCTISIQIDIFPYNSSSTHLSLSNLIMIIVLLNANATEI